MSLRSAVTNLRVLLRSLDAVLATVVKHDDAIEQHQQRIRDLEEDVQQLHNRASEPKGIAD